MWQPGHQDWLAVPSKEAKGDSLVVATRDKQAVELVTVEKVEKLIVRFDDRTADLDKPVTVTKGGKELFAGEVSRTVATLAKTLAGRGDPGLVFSAEVEVTVK